MPSFDVFVEGKTYHVEVPDPGACPLRVIVDGQSFTVAIQAGEVHALADLPAAAEAPLPSAPAAPETAPLPRPSPASAARVAATPYRGRATEVRAPMPGTILRVSVTAGHAVKPGDTVCILEAMKMKNPIRATGAGTVAEIAVGAGQNVAYNQLLIRIE